METRTMLKSELALRRAQLPQQPKLLSLHQLDASGAADELSAPMTPLGAGAGDNSACASAFSPRDPTTKLLAAKDGSSAASSSAFASHRLSLPSPSGSPSGSSSDSSALCGPDEDEDDEPSAGRPLGGAGSVVKPNTGRWTEAEHQLFLQGLEAFPYRAWKKIATLIKTRTVVQIRTHAQKYYQKLEKEEARLKEREGGSGHGHGNGGLGTETAAESGSDDAPATPMAAAPATPQCDSPRRPLLRKRKCAPLPSLDAGARGGFEDEDEGPLPSLPKRMLREKKAAAAHMSPKQKSPSAANKLFADMLDVAAAASASSSALHAQLHHPQLHHQLHHPLQLSVPRGGGGGFARLPLSAAGLLTPSRAAPQHAMPMLPLDFGDEDAASAGAADAMLLDLADDRALADLPFPLDAAALDSTLSSIDNDDLLQLTEEELDWFSADASAAADRPVTATETADEDAAGGFALGRFPFAAADEDEDECLRLGDELAMAGPLSCAPSPGLHAAAAAGFADEDDDFVLDPEKFLSSYLPSATAASAAAAASPRC